MEVWRREFVQHNASEHINETSRKYNEDKHHEVNVYEIKVERVMRVRMWQPPDSAVDV